jgi:protein-tyrosine phosphatase
LAVKILCGFGSFFCINKLFQVQYNLVYFVAHSKLVLLFFFSKNMPLLRDLIPDNYIDIHSHLLPGIDDGAQSIAHTLQMVKALNRIGFSEFVTTPHTMSHVWDNTKEGILSVKKQTIIELEKQDLVLPFRVASEYMMDENFVTLFKNNALLTLKDRHVLVEMSYSNAPLQLYSILFDLQVAGYIPVLAHPERYTFYHSNFDDYLKLKQVGCLFQLNLLAVVGYYGDSIAKVAEQLLQKGMYDFVGSDVHHGKHVAAFGERVKLKELLALQEAIANNQFFIID